MRLAAKELSDDLSDSAAQLTSGTWRRGGVTARDERTTLDAAGELPPYFITRAARRAGKRASDFEDELEEAKGKTDLISVMKVLRE